MATYVTSLLGSVTHIGNEERTECGIVLRSGYLVSTEPPAGYPLCSSCTGREADRAVNDARRHWKETARDALLVSLLAEGMTDAALARRLRLGQRTLSRWINDAIRRAGARSRFQWAFNAGAAAHVRRP